MSEAQANEARFLRRARAVLDAGAAAVPPATAARLAAARRRAVAAAARRPLQPRLVPATAFATALAVLVVLSGGPQPAFAPAPEALELLGANAPLELYEELEFYEWLDGQVASG